MATARSGPKARARAYIAATPPKARAALKRIRAAVLSAAPGAEEAFSYGIPAFRLGGKMLVWYAAFRDHCSLYPMTAAIRRAHAAELEGYETSKGTVRFPLSTPPPVRLVTALVKSRVTELRKKK
jgi:uncharacterized protein YdhG (YjbR/CyaY superfamily)